MEIHGFSTEHVSDNDTSADGTVWYGPPESIYAPPGGENYMQSIPGENLFANDVELEAERKHSIKEGKKPASPIPTLLSRIPQQQLDNAIEQARLRHWFSDPAIFNASSFEEVEQQTIQQVIAIWTPYYTLPQASAARRSRGGTLLDAGGNRYTPIKRPRGRPRKYPEETRYGRPRSGKYPPPVQNVSIQQTGSQIQNTIVVAQTNGAQPQANQQPSTGNSSQNVTAGIQVNGSQPQADQQPQPEAAVPQSQNVTAGIQVNGTQPQVNQQPTTATQNTHWQSFPTMHPGAFGYQRLGWDEVAGRIQNPLYLYQHPHRPNLLPHGQGFQQSSDGSGPHLDARTREIGAPQRYGGPAIDYRSVAHMHYFLERCEEAKEQQFKEPENDQQKVSKKHAPLTDEEVAEAKALFHSDVEWV
ncbi:hypothetical protein FLAG1_04341 [Fusarium langsethiae]|uniref:Uncharacterized protein n=1 Tax=Fusarium langsethiae TaxID=179993 RepID=A0A0M9EZ14_FUSLA|nr:hypothetical protein FLAG1_04341 [Fusarium langsethiae]GKU02117.1 unnamed protein product [Fusarium langsethiae]GKU19494.1 unnamed protein product [Fusarium langsethiae]